MNSDRARADKSGRSLLKTAVIVLMLSMIALVAVASQEKETEEKAPGQGSQLSTEQLAKAKELFTEKCARCHGADGRGQTVLGEMLLVPDFTDAKWWKEKNTENAELAKIIAGGKGEMPAFEEKLTRSEIANLIAYLRRFSKSSEVKAEH